jgi:transketolase
MRITCLQSVYELAKRDPRVLFIGSDLGAGVLSHFKEEMPDQFLMEGISEQHVIGMAAGLAKEGYIPYVNTIATFLTRRCYEQVAIDLCLQNLPVRLIGNGGGYVYAPLGPTHQAVEDIAIMRALPNMTIISPSDANQMSQLMEQTLDIKGPAYIRVAKGYDPIVTEGEQFTLGQSHLAGEVGGLLIIASGIMLQRALHAKNKLEEMGEQVAILNIHTLKPLDDASILDKISRSKLVVTMEEHTKIGGLGSSILELISDANLLFPPRVLRFGLPDRFTDNYGSQSELIDAAGLSVQGMVSKIHKASQESMAVC